MCQSGKGGSKKEEETSEDEFEGVGSISNEFYLYSGFGHAGY